MEYDDKDVGVLLSVLDKMDAYLTAAVVSNDVTFQNKVLMMPTQKCYL